MNANKMTDTKPPFLSGLLVFACLVIICAGLKLAADLLTPVLFAFTLTLLIWPFMRWLKQKKVPHAFVIIIVTGVGVLSLIAMMLIIGYSLNQLAQKLPDYTSQFNDKVRPLENYLATKHIDMKVIQNSGFNSTTMLGTVINSLSRLFSNLSSLAITLFSLLLMIISGDSLAKRFQKYYQGKGSFLKDFKSWSGNIQQQFLVQTVSNLLSGLVTTIIFIWLGIDLAPLWGVLVFFLAYIPNIGIILASIPPVILAFILYGWQTALLTIGLISLLNFVMDNVFTPRFMGETLKLPTIVVFLSFMFWTWIFGPIGAFISLPLTLAIRGLLATSSQSAFIAHLLTSEE